MMGGGEEGALDRSCRSESGLEADSDVAIVTTTRSGLRTATRVCAGDAAQGWSERAAR